MSKPRCENCRHHKLTNQPDSWMLKCTKDDEPVHRWYVCKEWEDENMDGNKCCLSCKYHEYSFDIPLPDFMEPECPYVRCTKTGKAMPKWYDCDEWEAEDETHHGQQS